MGRRSVAHAQPVPPTDEQKAAIIADMTPRQIKNAERKEALAAEMRRLYALASKLMPFVDSESEITEGTIILYRFNADSSMGYSLLSVDLAEISPELSEIVRDENANKSAKREEIRRQLELFVDDPESPSILESLGYRKLTPQPEPPQEISKHGLLQEPRPDGGDPTL